MRKAQDRRALDLTPETQRRLLLHCRALGTSYSEFVQFALNQAFDELDGYAREQRLIDEWYAQFREHRMIVDERREAH